MNPLLSFQSFVTNDEDLQPLRAALYRTDQPGYILLRNFVNLEIAEHLATLWNDTPPAPAFFDTTSTAAPRVLGQRPFAFFGNHRTAYHNYVWNKPFDEVAHNLCLQVTLLRNKLEQQPLYRHLFPGGKRMASYRIITTFNTEGITEVSAHDDYREEAATDEPVLKYLLQATLFLSRHGVDYEGDGFTFTTNTGDIVRFGPQIPVEPGDLLIWRYYNTHMVGSNRQLPGGHGFCRMLFPFELITMDSTSVDRPDVWQKGRKRLGKIFRGISGQRLRQRWTRLAGTPL